MEGISFFVSLEHICKGLRVGRTSILYFNDVMAEGHAQAGEGGYCQARKEMVYFFVYPHRAPRRFHSRLLKSKTQQQEGNASSPARSHSPKMFCCKQQQQIRFSVILAHFCHFGKVVCGVEPKQLPPCGRVGPLRNRRPF